MNWFGIDPLLRDILREDIAHGDVTTQACIPPDRPMQGLFIAKEAGVLCGLALVQRVFSLLDDGIACRFDVSDGDTVAKGTTIGTVQGDARALLMGERTALNLLQRLSGIATQTALAAAAVRGTKARIADTRKTTPLLWALEKYAVRTGGGMNHRFHLADGVLIKDNHIAAAGGIAQAVQAARASVPHTLKIEVETETLDEVRQALDAGADIIMLDNMSNEQMRQAVSLIAGRALTEASGNMGEKDLAAVAATGVEFISIGALTHSVKALDISLKFTEPA